MEFRFTLEPYRGMVTRYTCPQCNKHKVFSRYIDTQNGNHLGNDVGRCGREDQCGYHYKPSEFFKQHGKPAADDFYRAISFEHFKEPSYLAMELVHQSRYNQPDNQFLRYLARRFGMPDAIDACTDYYIGQAGHWHGDTVFWQIDTEGRVRTGKVMLYNGETGKRVKEPYNHIAWMHKLISPKPGVGSPKSKQTQDFNLKQCFFGEHLLNWFPAKPVGICESEKSAVMASICYPKLTWLAAGSLAGLNAEKCKCLAGRKVILVPDVNAYQKWEEKAAAITAQQPSVKFAVMPFLEINASGEHRQRGLDIADFL